MAKRDIVLGTAAVVGVTLLGLGVLVGCTWGLTLLLGDTVAAAILAGAAPLLATFSLALWNDYREYVDTVNVANRRQRGEAYRLFLQFLFDLIARLEDEDEPNEIDLNHDRYRQFLQGIMVWGSDELIAIWNEFRKVDLPDLSPEQRHAWVGRLLAQVRDDLRGADSDLSADALYELYSLESDSSDGST